MIKEKYSFSILTAVSFSKITLFTNSLVNKGRGMHDTNVPVLL